MRRTFILQFPDRAGVLLECCRHLADIGVNITRLSFNRVVDAHALFLEADGTSDQLEQAETILGDLGYLTAWPSDEGIVLFEFTIPDVPGSAVKVLELVAEFGFSASYVNARSNGSKQTVLLLGLAIDHPQELSDFMGKAAQIAHVRIIEYDRGEKILDNTVFYLSFAHDIDKLLNLGPQKTRDLTVLTNQVMQVLEGRGEAPYKTFDAIRGCATAIARYDNSHHEPRMTCFDTKEGLHVTLIEPPCGSNTCVIETPDRLVAVDAGLSCFSDNLGTLLEQCYPGFMERRRDLILTHAHLDHCGGSNLFQTIFASPICLECFDAERKGVTGIHEESSSGSAFISIYKILANHVTPPQDRLVALTGCEPPIQEGQAFRRADDLVLGELCFEVYAGAGGHSPGEIALIERKHRIAFSGDIYINIEGETKEQMRFNANAAYLMNPVDANPSMAKRERNALIELLGPGPWTIIGGHGPVIRVE
ncbi:MAG: MBL fold metallo-hydrolase [Coriobacteriales bacterium]|nr:MBL fold metallo-hydrolase [Coriobacteriales bacterium]